MFRFQWQLRLSHFFLHSYYFWLSLFNLTTNKSRKRLPLAFLLTNIWSRFDLRIFVFLFYTKVNRWIFYLVWMNNHRYTWSVLNKSMFITNNRSRRMNLKKSFNFDAIFKENGFYYTNQNSTEIGKNRTETESNKLICGFRVFRWPVTALV